MRTEPLAWGGRDKSLLAHDLLCHGADAGAASRGREEDDDAPAVRFASNGVREIKLDRPCANVDRPMTIQRLTARVPTRPGSGAVS